MVTDVIDVGPTPRGPVVTEDAIWLLHSSSTVARIDRQTRQVTDTIDLPEDGSLVHVPGSPVITDTAI